MKKLIPLFVFFCALISYAQSEELDKMELRDGQVLIGTVEKIKIDLVEFRHNETGLFFEMAKKDIRFIQLSSGKILTFEDYYQPVKKDETQPPQQTQQPVVTEKQKSDGPSAIILILGCTAVLVVGVLALIGGL